MNYLIDTNILVRLVDVVALQHKEASDAVKKLLTNKEDLHIIDETLIEFWVVATREKKYNGLEFSTGEANKEISNLLKAFILLPDSPLFMQWRNLVSANQIGGYKAYDARLVAAMMVHSIDRLLTFNDADFKYYSRITVETPKGILAKP